MAAKKQSLMEQLAEEYDGLVGMDGFDDCVVGIVIRYGQEPILCYDRELVLQQLMREGIPTMLEAEEFFEFNQIGAWVGDRTPCFLMRPEE